MKKLFHRTLAVVLTLALITSCFVTSAVFTASATETTVVYSSEAVFDFSNAAHLRQSNGTVSITDEQLVLSAEKGSQSRALLPFVPQTGKSYTVTLKYRSEHATDETTTSDSIDFNMNLGFDSSGWTMFRANEKTGSATLENTLIASGGTKLGDIAQPSSDDNGEWKTLSYTFTTPDSYATKDVTAEDGTVTTRIYKYLGFWIQPSKVKGTLYVDDIVISEAYEFDFSSASQVGNAYSADITDGTLRLYAVSKSQSRARLPFILENGKEYTVSLKYKAGVTADYNLRFYAAKESTTYGSWSIFGGDDEKYQLISDAFSQNLSADGEWVTAEYVISPSCVTEEYKYLGLRMQPHYTVIDEEGTETEDTTVTCELYIDDVIITEPGGTVAFDTLTDEVTVDSVSGDYREVVTLPTPVRYGYDFAGWYYDTDLTTAANAYVNIPAAGETKTLYAKWSYTGEAAFDFSNAAHLRQSNGTVSITDEQLVLSAEKGSQSRALLPFVPQTGKSYAVTLKYRSEHETDETTTSDSIDFNMNLGFDSSGWTMFRANEKTGNATLENTLIASGGTKLGDIAQPSSDDNGEWKTLSYTFTTPDSYATKDVTAEDGTVTTRIYKYLGFWIQPSKVKGTLYIDDIVISEADGFDFSSASQVGNAYSADITDGTLRLYAVSRSQSRARLLYNLENEKVYKVSLKYKAGVTADYNLRFYAAKASTTYGSWGIFGGNSGESSQLISTAFSQNLSADGEWVTEEYVIFPKCVTDEYKYLGLWMQPYYTVIDEEGTETEDQTVTCELYIDDVAVTEMGGAVILNYNDGVTANKELIGYNAGDAVVLPTPTREGYNFDGWYSDAELTAAVGETYTVVEEKVNLYAKWVAKVAAETPAAPTIAEHTQDSVTLTAIDGYEYSMDGEVWQSESVFTGLLTGTKYSFYQRVAETETALASAASEATVYTIVAQGDANGDGDINALDLTVIRKILLGQEVEYNADGANANGDDAINLKDLVCLKKAVAAQAATATLMAIDNVDITAFSLNNSLDSKTGTEIEDTFTSSVNARTGKELAASSDNIIEISIDEALESDTYKIYVENGNMYITATSEYVLLEAIRVLSDRISDYPTERTLNLQDGYTFSGKYLGIKTRDKYSLVWNDEFNGTELDSSKWTVNKWTERDTWIDRENETDGSTLKYTDEYITVSDGAVHLGSVTVDNGDGTYSFYGSDIRTNKKMTFSYGYFEARMKLPGGVGQWSAFWANGFRDSASTNANDYSTEIDVMENFGYTDKYHTDLHVWGNSTVDGLLNEETDQYGNLKYHKDMLSGVTVTSDTLASEYHTYGCEWTDTALKLYFDGTCYYELVYADFADGYVNSTAVAEHFANLINGDELQLLLSTGSAPGHYNNFTGATVTDENYVYNTEMTVDYVRLYQLGGKENFNYTPSVAEEYKYIAITFDDAPNAAALENSNLGTFVDILTQYGGKGTVFLNGTRIDQYGTDTLEGLLDKGFELGNHTYTHTNLTTLTEAGIREEIVSLNELVKQELNYDIKWLRPGELAVNSTVYKVATELGMPVIGSGGDAGDWRDTATAESIKTAVINGAYDGQIVLMHAWSNKSAEAFEEIISTLYDQGYRFVTLSELFEAHGVEEIPTDVLIRDSTCK